MRSLGVDTNRGFEIQLIDKGQVGMRPLDKTLIRACMIRRFPVRPRKKISSFASEDFQMRGAGGRIFFIFSYLFYFSPI